MTGAPICMVAFFYSFFKYGHILLIIQMIWWIIKVKHSSSGIYEKKNVTHNEDNMLQHTLTLWSFSFVIDSYCMCYSGSFPIALSVNY